MAGTQNPEPGTLNLEPKTYILFRVNGVTYNNMMMELGLTDEEVADVMNYILNSWGNKSQSMVTAREVTSIKAD